MQILNKKRILNLLFIFFLQDYGIGNVPIYITEAPRAPYGTPVAPAPSPYYTPGAYNHDNNRKLLRIADYIYENGKNREAARALTQLPVEQYIHLNEEEREKIFYLVHEHKSTWLTGFFWQLLFGCIATISSSLIVIFVISNDLGGKTLKKMGIGFANVTTDKFDLIPLEIAKKHGINPKSALVDDSTITNSQENEDMEILIEMIKDTKAVNITSVTPQTWQNARITLAGKIFPLFLLYIFFFPILNLIGLASFSNQRYFNTQNIMINSAFLLTPSIIGTIAAYFMGFAKIVPIVQYMLIHNFIFLFCNMLRWYFLFYKSYNETIIGLSNSFKDHNIFYDSTTKELVMRSCGNPETDHLLCRNSAEKILNAMEF